MVDKPEDRAEFEAAIRALEGTLANAGVHLSLDGAAREAYNRRLREFVEELRGSVASGQKTLSQAAREAVDLRNTIMELVRGRSTPVGLAFAEQLKLQGRTLNELVAKKALELFGPLSKFENLSPIQKNQVYAAIVESAGRSNPRVTLLMRRLSRAGRGLLVLSVGYSVYTIATSEDRMAALGKEVTVTGAGIGGGIAGGALAGLACGPGAPVCVAVGAFVGGALGAIGVDILW